LTHKLLSVEPATALGVGAAALGLGSIITLFLTTYLDIFSLVQSPYSGQNQEKY
jgi:hypothetical protein